MTSRAELLAAPEAVLRIVIEQGEKRLAGQIAFADSQDQRGGAIINAAVALAAAAVALGAANITKPSLFVGSVIAVTGFSAAASIAMWALRSRGFHSLGYYPSDFNDDIIEGKTVKDLLVDYAQELQHRLSENKPILDERGTLTNLATWALLGTPIGALIAAYIRA
ncbi:MAG TPA: hypothetical protein PLH31_08625 [Caulobacter sp.]|nr:hypothetical protein [Caulobacter sp.]